MHIGKVCIAEAIEWRKLGYQRILYFMSHFPNCESKLLDCYPPKKDRFVEACSLYTNSPEKQVLHAIGVYFFLEEQADLL